MESSNPVLSRKEFSRGGYATFNPATPSPADLQAQYDAPPAGPLQTGRMTLDDVVMRTALTLGTVVATAAATFLYVKPGLGIVIGAAIVGLVLGLVISFSKTIRPALILAYAAIEGVFVGGISYWYNQYQPGIVVQAVLGTLCAFGVMLFLYKTGVIRATPKFTKILLIAAGGYLVFGLLNFVLAMVTSGRGAYDITGLGLLLAAAGVVLASLFLVLDFDQIEQGVRNGLPQQYSWLCAFGLTVTLVWLYLEILRLISIIRGD
ncbi:Bax inhibitor-1/YccA family protein [Spongisporangium articulatum]|uniref:Bax inhibitor-1/YccA family protein n=1 Tax=Spongisporangium articulatum TaxID=3362603 RepID=A0ABW8AQK6_9ACTN